MVLHRYSLNIERVIHAPRTAVFAAWTDPAALQSWWQPRGVTCPAAEVDLREGGAYRIVNRAMDGSTRWIDGRFQRVSRPQDLTYTWPADASDGEGSLVQVAFRALWSVVPGILLRFREKFPDDALGRQIAPDPEGTRVDLTHEGFASEADRDVHVTLWADCLDALERTCAPAAATPGLSKAARLSLSRGEMVAAEVPATRVGHRRFVTARPFTDLFDEETAHSNLPWHFRVTRYEIRNDFIFDESATQLLVDRQQEIVDTLSELEAILAAWAPSGAFHPNREVLAPL